MDIHVTRDHDRGIETTQRTLLKCASGIVTIGESTMEVRDVEVRDKPVETKIAILSGLSQSSLPLTANMGLAAGAHATSSARRDNVTVA